MRGSGPPHVAEDLVPLLFIALTLLLPASLFARLCLALEAGGLLLGRFPGAERVGAKDDDAGDRHGDFEEAPG